MTTTEQQPATPAATPAVAAPAADVTPDAPATGAGPPQSDADAGRTRRDPSAEAAARRLEVRKLEGENGQLAAQIITMQRNTIEAALATASDIRGDGSFVPSLQRAADLWETLGATPEQFFNADGNYDPAALADFLDAIPADRLYLTRETRNTPPTNPGRDALDRLSSTSKPVGGSWQSALRS